MSLLIVRFTQEAREVVVLPFDLLRDRLNEVILLLHGLLQTLYNGLVLLPEQRHSSLGSHWTRSVPLRIDCCDWSPSLRTKEELLQLHHVVVYS